MAALDTSGSMEYEQTWRRKTTPSGLRIFRLAARARRTSAPGCSGYPSPSANGFECQDLVALERRREELLAKWSNGNGFGLTLQQAITLWLAGYPTPKAKQGEYQYSGGDHDNKVLNLEGVVQLVGYPTPCVNDRTGPRTPAALEIARKGGASKLNEVVLLLAGWATTCATDGSKAPKKYGGGNLTLNGMALASGTTTFSCPAATAKSDGRRLNPGFSLWLMGYQAAWLCCGELAIALCLKSRRRSSGRTSKRKGADSD